MTTKNAVTTADAPFDVIRAAYAELIVSDLDASRHFYVDILGLVVTHEDDDAIYLRAFEEYLHHSLVLRKGPTPALGALAYRVRAQEQVALAADHFEQLGCALEHRTAGAATRVATTRTGRGRSRGSTTSTSSPPMCPRRRPTTSRSDSR